MKRRLLIAVTIAGALLLPAASSTRAIGDPNIFIRLPFTRATCQTLIDRGAPFQLGGPDTGPGDCFVVVIGGMPRR